MNNHAPRSSPIATITPLDNTLIATATKPHTTPPAAIRADCRISALSAITSDLHTHTLGADFLCKTLKCKSSPRQATRRSVRGARAGYHPLFPVGCHMS